MGFKKKKNVLIITVIVICSFILYQLYFFSTLSLSAENSKSHMYESGESIQKSYADKVHVRTEQDKFINEKGAIRGVLLSNMPRYRPATGDTFHCLTTDQSIPYDQVNDDYCDCDDGSDEPSTNACVNGTFYCDTQHKRKPLALVHVPSSVVNDGICDCCDGSDEWIQRTNKYLTQGSVDLLRHLADHCPNIC